MYREERSPRNVLLSIFGSSFTAMFLTHPLEVVKVRLQKDRAICNGAHFETIPCVKKTRLQEATCQCIPFSTTLKAMGYLRRNEGFMTLFSGFFERTLMSVTPIIFFLVMERTRSELYKIKEFPDILVGTTAAGVARCVAISLTFPLEYVATLKQAKMKFTFRSVKQFAMGLKPLIFRDILFSIIIWSVTDTIRQTISSKTRKEISPLEVLLTNSLCGSLGGVVASVLTYPLDVVKTRWQIADPFKEETQNRKLFKTIKEIYQKEGLDSLFYGVRPKMAKSGTSGGMVIGFYELFYQLLSETKKK